MKKVIKGDQTDLWLQHVLVEIILIHSETGTFQYVAYFLGNKFL